MTFGVGIGDIIAVGELAWTLYRDCYAVARGAPQEFQVLTGEIATLSGSLKILQEEVDDPNSVLIRSGEDRIKMVNEMVARIHVTLKELQQVAKKYGILQTGSRRKKVWAKFKWSVDFRGIEGLRNKLIYHNTVMNLLLTSVGNSSLKRFESTTQALETDIREIKARMRAISGPETEHSSAAPLASIVTDEAFKLSFSETLMMHAEALQPWSTIGLDRWVRAGRWWLLKAQMELSSAPTTGAASPQAYANLIKASWILIDIIASHPQVIFLKSSAQYEVQALSSELKQEMKRVTERGVKIPSWSSLEKQDLRIWEMKGQAPRLLPGQSQPKGDSGLTQSYPTWSVRCGRVFFQQFGIYAQKTIPDPVTCIVLILVDEDPCTGSLLIQDQEDNILMNVRLSKDMRLHREVDCVFLDGNKVTFPAEEDAKYLAAVTEGTVLYLYHTNMVRMDFIDLSGTIALMCIKNGCQAAVLRLVKHPREKDDLAGCSDSVLAVALDLAYQLTTYQLGNSISNGDSEQTPVLEWAVWHRLHPVVRILLTKGLETTRLYYNSEQSPLMLAVSNADEISSQLGNAELVRVLLDTKADTKTYEEWDNPLRIATEKNHEACVRVLAEHGFPGNSALNEAVKLESEALVEILASNGATHAWALVEAVQKCNANIVRILLAHGADPNSLVEKHDGDYDTWHKETHWTALHAAVVGAETEIVQILLANGADVNATAWILNSSSDYPGQGTMDNTDMEWAITPLHLAVLRNHETMAQILIDNGADLNSILMVGDDERQSHKHRLTPLHIAAKHGHLTLTRLLLELGASDNIVDGKTALQMAIQAGHSE
ncbi:ankyrin repeat-containing domain protein [Aspergillus recurvatus]